MYNFLLYHITLIDHFMTRKSREHFSIYTSISFWDNKVLKASLGMPGHVRSHPPKVNDHFINLVDMKCLAQN